MLSCGATMVARSSRIASRHEPRVEAVDAEHYSLELWLRPEERRIEGTCHLRFSVAWGSVDEVELQLEGLSVTAVTDGDGRPLAFEHDEGVIEITLEDSISVGQLGEVVVSYGGSPAKGLWFVNDLGAARSDVRHVFTQGECVDAHWWFPCLDYPSDRATSEIRVHMPSDWVAVAAGQRIDLVEGSDQRIEHWRMNTPHPVYLTTLCAGVFEQQEDDWDGIPLLYLSDPRYVEWMPASFSETGEILGYFSELTGKRYPYPKYAQVCVGNFPFGGMENISATTMTEGTLGDELSQRDGTSVGLVAHEAAHQWFGDLITCNDWAEIWLNEGFATYLTNLYYERTRGADEFRIRMRDAQLSYTAADVGSQRRPTVHDFYKDPFDLFFDGKAYAGGASRLHLLRFELGDEAFFRGIQLYVSDNEGRSVSTEDLRDAMETASGRDLEAFFDQWLYGSGYPELLVSWSWDEALGQVDLEVEQIQDTDRGTPKVFSFAVDVELRNAAGRSIHRLEVNEREENFTLASESLPVWVRFDKYSWLPARVLSKKKGSEWIAIAAEDDDVNGRRDAVDALGRLFATEEDPEKAAVYRTAILRRLRDDEHEAVRLEAVEAFGRVKSPESRGFLMRAAIEDESAAVREATLKSLAPYGVDPELAELAQESFDAGYSWDVLIAAAMLRAASNPAGAYEWILERTDIPSPHGKLRAGLIGVLSALEDERVLGDLLLLADREDQTSAVRQAAVAGLGIRGSESPEARELLIQLLETDDYRLRGGVIDALANFKDPAVIARLNQELQSSPYSPERRKIETALKSLGVPVR